MKLNSSFKIATIIVIILLLVASLAFYTYLAFDCITGQLFGIKKASDIASLAACAESVYIGVVLDFQRYATEGTESYRRNAQAMINHVLTNEYLLLDQFPDDEKQEIVTLISRTKMLEDGLSERFQPLHGGRTKEQSVGNAAEADELLPKKRDTIHEFNSTAQIIQLSLNNIANNSRQSVITKIYSVEKYVGAFSEAFMVLWAFVFTVVAALGVYLVRQLHLSEERMKNILNMTDLIIRISQQGKIIELIEPSQNHDDLLKINVGSNISEIFPDDELDKFRQAIRRISNEGGVQEVELELRSDHGLKVYKVRMISLGNDEIMAIIRDITERHQVDAILKRVVQGLSAKTGEAYFTRLVKYLAELFGVKYAFIGELSDNKFIQTIACYANGKYIKNWRRSVKGSPCEPVTLGQLSCFTSGVADLFYDDKSLQDMKIESFVGIPLTDSENKVTGIMVIMDDRPIKDTAVITSVFQIFAGKVSTEMERQKSENKIQYLAYYDSMTGMPNRWRFTEWLNTAVVSAAKCSEIIGVLRFDLDDFKFVNDGIGYAAGDELVVAAAQRFKKALKSVSPSSTVARLGGDEFAVFVRHVQTQAAVAEVADEIIDSLKEPFLYDSHVIHLTTSVGISMFPRDGETADELLNNAVRALNFAKEQSRGSYQFYDPALQAEEIKRLTTVNELRKAVTNNELLLFYQPQFSTINNKLIGMEALLRWNHPRRGLLSPAEFIPFAESSGLIITIGEWVLREACRQLKTYQDKGFGATRVAVNISPIQFMQPGFVQSVKKVISETGLSPAVLELEITESITMMGIERVESKLKELASLGVIISIDDFGTGYSSLAYLNSFPVRTLKIDRSFVCNMMTNSGNASIVSAIIALAHNLGMYVVAEGVETDEEFGFLKDRLCDVVQGYLLGKPIPAEEMLKKLKEWTNERRLYEDVQEVISLINNKHLSIQSETGKNKRSTPKIKAELLGEIC